MDKILQHPINARIHAPLPSGYTSWSDYYKRTGDYSMGPAVAVVRPPSPPPVRRAPIIDAPAPPRGYANWNDYYHRTGDWSIGPAVTVIRPIEEPMLR